jgi:hypothetical protein
VTWASRPCCTGTPWRAPTGGRDARATIGCGPAALYYQCLKQFFENGAAGFGPAPRADKQVEAREQRIAFLESREAG